VFSIFLNIYVIVSNTRNYYSEGILPARFNNLLDVCHIYKLHPYNVQLLSTAFNTSTQNSYIQIYGTVQNIPRFPLIEYSRKWWETIFKKSI